MEGQYENLTPGITDSYTAMTSIQSRVVGVSEHTRQQHEERYKERVAKQSLPIHRHHGHPPPSFLWYGTDIRDCPEESLDQNGGFIIQNGEKCEQSLIL